MRVALMMTVLCVAACTTDRLALAPPPDTDMTGRWTLNVADSDDPQRVAQSQLSGRGPSPGSQDGRGGRGRGTPGGSVGGPLGPSMPGIGAISDGLRWPGKDLEIQQTGGVVTVISMGTKQVYRPIAGSFSARVRKTVDAPSGRESRFRGDGPPTACGWDGKILVIQPENSDDDYPPYEERYSLSTDGQRLVEVLAFKGGRSRGFTVSRVWDRAAALVGGKPAPP